MLPLGGFLWGTGRCLVRLQPQWIPYFAGYLVFNYGALLAELVSGLSRRRRR